MRHTKRFSQTIEIGITLKSDTKKCHDQPGFDDGVSGCARRAFVEDGEQNLFFFTSRSKFFYSCLNFVKGAVPGR